MRSGLRVTAALGAGAAAAHLVPSVLTVPPLHRRWLPRLSGQSGRPHVALTFDDGPDSASTPAFLECLAQLDVSATFFLLGQQLAGAPMLGRRLVDAGHEVAVHGWTHTPHLLRTPWAVTADIARATEVITDCTGERPRFWRPPNGVLSGAGLVAARRLQLRPVLWTADGQDWRPDATAASIACRLQDRLGAGATVLLHDSDITSAPGSWRAALAAVAPLVGWCRAQGWAVGPLREHG